MMPKIQYILIFFILTLFPVKSTLLGVDNSKIPVGKAYLSAYETSTYRGKIVINEFVPNPYEDEDEWIELFNPGEEKISLIGWKISDSNYSPKDISGELFPQEFLLIEPSPVVLNNGGDSLILFDSESRIVDKIEYGDEGMIETSNETESIGRLPDSLKWTVFNKQTKGTQNPGSAFTYLELFTSLQKNSFNPIEGENLIIDITLTCPAELTIKIYDFNGYLVKTICEDRIITQEDISFLWNGKFENNEFVNSGGYLCYVETKQEDTLIKKEMVFSVNGSQKKSSGCLITSIITRKTGLLKYRDQMAENKLIEKVIDLYYEKTTNIINLLRAHY